MMEKLIFIIVMVIALYLSISVVQNFSIKFDLLNQVLSGFNIGYIEKIKIFNSTKCPENENYEEVIKDFDWPGNYKGCGCLKNKNSKKKLKGNLIEENEFPNLKEDFNFNYGYCPKEKNCFPVEETFPENLNKWRKEVICIKRSKFSYLDLNLTQSPDKDLDALDKNSDYELPCSNSTHKNCGIIDGSENNLCIKREQECPINDIRIINLEEIKSNSIKVFNDKGTYIIKQESFKFNNYYLLKISEKLALIYSNEEIKVNENPKNTNMDLKNIPIKFRVEVSNYNKKPCLSDFKHPKNSLFFPLIKNKFNYMCDLFPNKTQIFDENAKIIDTYPLKDFFEDNDYLKEIKEILLPFNFEENFSKRKINLFSRNYIGWKYKCLISSSLSLRNFIFIEENLNNILILNILHSFISIGGIIVLGIFACFLSKYFEILFKFMNLVFCLFNLIFPIQIISNSNWIINLFTDEKGEFCGDISLNILLKEISDSCLQLQNSYIWILLITIFYTFFFIFMMYYWIKPFHNEYQDRLKNYINMK